MKGKIEDIDFISGSADDREGGITLILKDGREIDGSAIEFDMTDLTYELS